VAWAKPRAPAGQRGCAVGRSTNTNCYALECPVGTPKAHPVCSIPQLRPANLVLRSTKPIARFLRAFWTPGILVRVWRAGTNNLLVLWLSSCAQHQEQRE
jgi:hypothetical protein